MSGRDRIRVLERRGYVRVATKGSHAQLRHAETRVKVTVPLHDELTRGTLRAILRYAEMSVEELVAELRG